MKPKMTTSYAPNEFRLIPPKSSKIPEIVYDFGSAENLPQLNMNTPAWMPAFLAPADKDKMEQNSSRLREIFLESIQGGQEEEEPKELWMPKPPDEMRYCGVCKKSFEDYLVHIRSEEHVNNMKTNPFLLALRSQSKNLAAEKTESNVLSLFSQEVTFDS